MPFRETFYCLKNQPSELENLASLLSFLRQLHPLQRDVGRGHAPANSASRSSLEHGGEPKIPPRIPPGKHPHAVHSALRGRVCGALSILFVFRMEPHLRPVTLPQRPVGYLAPSRPGPNHCHTRPAGHQASCRHRRHQPQQPLYTLRNRGLARTYHGESQITNFGTATTSDRQRPPLPRPSPLPFRRHPGRPAAQRPPAPTSTACMQYTASVTLFAVHCLFFSLSDGDTSSSEFATFARKL